MNNGTGPVLSYPSRHYFTTSFQMTDIRVNKLLLTCSYVFAKTYLLWINRNQELSPERFVCAFTGVHAHLHLCDCTSAFPGQARFFFSFSFIFPINPRPVLKSGHVCPVIQTLPVCCHGYGDTAGLVAWLQGLLFLVLTIRHAPQWL